MENKFIVRIAEGLGNQLFMYANAYSLSKKFNYKLYVDNTSGFIKTKNFREYYLDKFNITAPVINNANKFDTFSSNIKRSFLKKIDFLRKNKQFIVEKRNKNKITEFNDICHNKFSNKVFIEGHYESEKYFINHKNELINEFTFKNIDDYKNNYYFDLIKKNSNNIVSISVRTNRFSERINNKFNDSSIQKSVLFIKDTIDYINRATLEIEKKISNPIYLIWSNDFTNLRSYFPNQEKFIFVENKSNKIFQDFFLFNFCNNFIVGPTSFHWWGAWLNNNPNKICLRPKNLNPSKNVDFWPKDWISI